VSTILVIGDDPHVRRFLRTLLSGQGHSIIEAGTAKDGVDQPHHSRPDVVLLDLDGLSVLAAMAPDQPRIPVIVLSARRQESDKVSALDNGADDYLTVRCQRAQARTRSRTASMARHGGWCSLQVARWSAAIDLIHAQAIADAGFGDKPSRLRRFLLDLPA
jgi:DNA-binding response OmpR family regulator